MESHWGSLIQAKVNYVKKNWEVYATYIYAGLAEGLVPNHSHGHSGWHVRRRNGTTYLCRDTAFPCILAVNEIHRRLVPKTVAVMVTDWGEPLPIIKKAFSRPGAVPKPNIAQWVDRNDDGRVSADEITGETAPEMWGSGHPYYAEDFTFYSPRVNTWLDHCGVSILKVQEWHPARAGLRLRQEDGLYRAVSR